MSDEPGKQILGLTRLETTPLERVLVRRRESQVTTAAWRLELTCDQGTGSIVRIEATTAQLYYRGDGILLGWSQEHLAELYAELTRPDGDGGPDFELMQLG